jgi:hypothetical protein
MLNDMKTFAIILALACAPEPSLAETSGECAYDAGISAKIPDSEMKEAILASARSRCVKMNEDIKAGKMDSGACLKSGTLQVDSLKFQTCVLKKSGDREP